jgi:hypothetical protein
MQARPTAQGESGGSKEIPAGGGCLNRYLSRGESLEGTERYPGMGNGSSLEVTSCRKDGPAKALVLNRHPIERGGWVQIGGEGLLSLALYRIPTYPSCTRRAGHPPPSECSAAGCRVVSHGHGARRPGPGLLKGRDSESAAVAVAGGGDYLKAPPAAGRRGGTCSSIIIISEVYIK